MSLFGRILSRAALPGHPLPPLARPKGLAGSIARATVAEPEEDEVAAPLARAAVNPQDKEEEARPLRRAPVPGEEEEEAQPLRRAAEPEGEEQPAAPLRRLANVPGEEEAQPLRRAAGEPPEEEDARPLRRAAAPPEEEEAQPLRRAPPVAHRYPVLPARIAREAPEAEALTAENSPRPAETSGQPENEPAMALRRDAGRPATSPPPAPLAGPVFDPRTPQIAPDVPDLRGPSDLWQAFEPDRSPPPTRADWPAFEPPVDHGQPAPPERPRVVIEQIDVTITEPASAGQGQADFAASLSRAIRSRYLGR